MSAPLLFNPSRATTEELEATLVAGAAVVEELERSLVADAAGPAPRHWLIVAPRGSGKSHVTEVLARRMRLHAGWSVVRLPEESYRVHTVGELLVWIVGALEGSIRPFGAETDRSRLETLAEERLKRWRLERGPVLVVLENLGEILGRRFSRRDQAKLRTLLLGDPPFTLVATATRLIPAVVDHDAPFYDFFQERRLDELDAAQVADLVERRARHDGATEILEHLDEVRPRVAALHHLSGGNPRLVLALFRVLRAGLTREIYGQLMALLDEVTPYYQARLGDASPQGARVLAEMAAADGPLLPKEIGRRTGLPTNQVTAILAQLQQERFVRPGGRPEDKRARYWEVTDRLFRVWLQMREQGGASELVRWIVEFYAQWYNGADQALPLVGEIEVDRALGPNGVLARAAAGESLSAKGRGGLTGFLSVHNEPRMAIPSLRRGLQALYARGGDDAEAARVEACFPAGDILSHAVLRTVRAYETRNRNLPFARDKPFHLDPGTVLTAWRSGAADLTERLLRADLPILPLYEDLRDLGLLPACLPPWSDAARVVAAPDREAALSALHPEVREAVVLVLGGEKPVDLEGDSIRRPL